MESEAYTGSSWEVWLDKVDGGHRIIALGEIGDDISEAEAVGYHRTISKGIAADPDRLHVTGATLVKVSREVVRRRSVDPTPPSSGADPEE